MPICLVYAHPWHSRSRANAALLAAVADLPGVDVRRLYDLYPDFDVDVAAEQQALARADVVVLQHPIYWYSLPPLAKLWIDRVLAAGWAYSGGRALAGKRWLWVVTTGGGEADYAPDGPHERPFESFVAPIEQTARFCGMSFLPPLVVRGAHRIDDAALAATARGYRARLEALLADVADVAGGPADTR
jgi:glutathione-regulated potassium-efflux system ancillary protein KefF